MNRVSLDANVLFSAAWRENTGLLRLWQSSDTTLLTSRYAFEEARRNLETEEQRQRLATLMVESQFALIEEQDPYALDHSFETRGAEGEHD